MEVRSRFRIRNFFFLFGGHDQFMLVTGFLSVMTCLFASTSLLFVHMKTDLFIEFAYNHDQLHC